MKLTRETARLLLNELKLSEETTKVFNASAPPKEPPAPAAPPPAARGVSFQAKPDAPKWQTWDFDTPMDLLLFCYDFVTPDEWQEEVTENLAGYIDFSGEKTSFTKELPLVYSLVAVNGAGKDSYINAPLLVWWLLTKIRSLSVSTSASYNQLKTQTYAYTKNLCEAFEAKIGKKIFDITEFHIKCLETGSEAKMFVTDEKGKAEGYHPFPDYPGAEMLVLINEAKSIADPLWTGFARFTGFTTWLEISSAGLTQGRFYRRVQRADRDHIRPGKAFARIITADMCSAIPKAHLDAVVEDFGSTSEVANSMISSTFVDSEEDNVIISPLDIKILENTPVKFVPGDYGIGLDLALGGDEVGCYVRHGNRVINKLAFREKNSKVVTARIATFLEQYKRTSYVFNADNGGVGNPIITDLQADGWRIIRCNNQSAPKNRKWYGNRGAELWGHLKALIQQQRIIIPFDDTKLINQITTRRTGPPTAQGRVTLQSKKEARNDGRPSPDRADALALCFISLPIEGPKPAQNSDQNLLSVREAMALYSRGLPPVENKPAYSGTFTYL